MTAAVKDKAFGLYHFFACKNRAPDMQEELFLLTHTEGDVRKGQ